MHHDKVYVGKMHLHSDISEETLKQEMKKFNGRIMQKPPVKSAVKRVLRPRTINKFEITEKNGRDVSFIADVEAGTYIRKLISDLGENIGGAHMIELKRIRAGVFKEENSHNLEEITKAFELYKEKKDETKLREILIPAEIITELLPVVQIKDNEKIIKDLLNGIALKKQDLEDEKQIPESDLFLVFSKDKFIGIYEKINKIKDKEKIDEIRDEKDIEDEERINKPEDVNEINKLSDEEIIAKTRFVLN
jgi:H/ACA ribonucleoprotein complex subunit 4